MAKKVLVFAMFIATVLLMVACNKTEDKEVVIWAWNRNVDILTDAIERYQADVDSTFKARVESFSQNDIDAKFLTARELNEATMMADIMLLDSNNVRRYNDLWPELFLDFNAYGVTNEMKSKLVESTVDLATIGDKLVAMPYGIAPTVVFAYTPIWNQETLNNVIENGWTWADYHAIGLEIKSQHTDVYMTAYNMRGDDRIYRTMTSQKGEWMMASDLSVEIGNANSVEAMTMIKDMFDDGVIGHIDTGDYKGLMKNGQIAAQVHGFFVGGQMKDVAPEQSGDYKVLPLPRWENDTRSDSITGGSFLYVNAKSSAKGDAASFVKWMALEEVNAISALEIGGIYPALIDAYSSEYFMTKSDEYYGNQKVLLDVSQFTMMAKPIYPSKYMGYNFTQLVTAQENILFEAANISTALSEAKTAIENNAN